MMTIARKVLGVSVNSGSPKDDLTKFRSEALKQKFCGQR